MQDKVNFLFIVTLLVATFSGYSVVQAAPGTVWQPSIGTPNITSPTNNSQVTSPLIIKGTAIKNGQIEVSVEANFTGGSQSLGTFKATANSKGEWSTTPINLWVPEEAKNVKFQISATQTVNNVKSNPKEVTVLPPQKLKTISRNQIKGNIITQQNPGVASTIARPMVAEKRDLNPVLAKAAALPTITSPNNQTVITTPLIVEGTAQRGSIVDVTIESNIAKPDFNNTSVRANVDENGKWKTAPINLWLFEDATDARFTITATEKIPRIDKPRQSRSITVIPSINQNFPRHPIKPWGISIGPKAGKNVISPLVITGSAGKERTVQIYITSHYTDSKGKRVDLPRINTSAISDNKGKWETSPITLPTPKTESQLTHNVSVNQIGLGLVSGNSNYKIMSDPNRVVRPVITSPNSRASVSKKQVFSGTGVPHRIVEVAVARIYNKKTMPPKYPGFTFHSGPYKVEVDANGNWQTPKMDMGKDKEKEFTYKFTVIQIFPKYDHKNNDGTYPEVRSEPIGMTLRQAENF